MEYCGPGDRLIAVPEKGGREKIVGGRAELAEENQRQK